jgi:hypothetical protein
MADAGGCAILTGVRTSGVGSVTAGGCAILTGVRTSGMGSATGEMVDDLHLAGCALIALAVLTTLPQSGHDQGDLDFWGASRTHVGEVISCRNVRAQVIGAVAFVR